MMLHFEDFHVGQTFALGPRAILAEEIKHFAAEFDPQPFHLDEEAAKSSVLGGLSASGFHTAALLLRMMHDSFLARSAFRGIDYMDRLSWKKPVFSGDVLTGTCKTLRLWPSFSEPETGTMQVEAVLFDQRGVRKVELDGMLSIGRSRQ